MAFLTSRNFITNVNLNNLFHIVDPSDPSQGNPAGSSYKVSIEQIRDFYNQYYVNVTGDTMTGDLILPNLTATTINVTNLTGDTINVTNLTGDTINVTNLTGDTILVDNLTGVTANTGTLVIYNTPTTDPSNNQVLVRDSTTGIVELKDFTQYNFGLFVQTGDSATVVNTITETTILDGGIGSLSVPANYFSPGDSFHVKIGGIVSANNGNTITFSVKSGSVILGTDTITFTNGVTNRSWEFNCDFTIRTIGGPTVASIMTNGTFMYNVSSDIYGGGFSTLNNTTFDTTNPNTLDFTVTWGSASLGNSIYSSMCILKKTF